MIPEVLYIVLFRICDIEKDHHNTILEQLTKTTTT